MAIKRGKNLALAHEMKLSHLRSTLFLLLIPCLLIGSPIVTAQDSPSTDIRVMSFNLRYGSADDGPNHWKLRQDLVRHAIGTVSPDLLGTQETLPFQAEFVGQQFPELEYVGRSREVDNPDGEQCALYFRRSRFDKLAQGHFWLSESPDQPGTKSWDSALPRMATWVLLHDRPTKRTVCFVNTHFDHVGQVAREESAKLIKRRAAALEGIGDDTWIVLTGDFNTGEDTPPYRAFRNGSESDWTDTYRAAFPERKPEKEGTFGAWVGKADGPRIDWILVDPRFETRLATIESWNSSGRYPSDHFPVTATIRFPAAEAGGPDTSPDTPPVTGSAP